MFATILCVLAIVTLLILLVFRRHPVVLGSSYIFCNIMVFSLFFYAAFIVMFSVNTDKASVVPCFVSWACLAIAFDLNMGSLLIKTWRIARIFRNSRHLQVKSIPNSEVLTYLCIVVLYDVILFTLFAAVDMPSGQRRFESQEEVWKCHSHNQTTWVLFAVAPKAFMLIFGIAVAAQVRDVPSNFNESMHFGWCIYNAFLMTSFSLAQQFFMPDANLVGVICISFIGIVTIVTIFLPKLLRIIDNSPQAAQSGFSTSSERESSRPPVSSKRASDTAGQGSTLSQVATTLSTPTARKKSCDTGTSSQKSTANSNGQFAMPLPSPNSRQASPNSRQSSIIHVTVSTSARSANSKPPNLIDSSNDGVPV